jgi:hypothetical protein
LSITVERPVAGHVGQVTVDLEWLVWEANACWRDERRRKVNAMSNSFVSIAAMVASSHWRR